MGYQNNVKVYSSGVIVSSANTLYDQAIQKNGNNSMFVSSGGTAVNTTINSGGAVYVYSGGTQNSNTVNSGGSLWVHNGAVNSTAINPNGSMFVYSGGTANHTTIANGGHLWIDNAAADNTTVNSGGVLMVYLSGKANNVQVDSDGCLYVYSGGIVNDAAIHSSGYANIYSGGIANRITVSTSGYFNIGSNGTANSTTVHSSGYFNIGSNGTANKTEIRSGGYAAVYGKAVDLDVKYGGSAYIRENAVCSGTINVGGKMTAASADDISPAKSVNFILGAAPQSGAYLTINEGNLENTMTVSADITQACGTYTLMKGGAGSLSSITIKYDEQNTRLFVGITITVTADVSAQLIRSGSDLKITVQVNDTIPPVVPSGVSGTLKDNVLSVSWNEVTDRTGVSYEIEYSKDGSFASGVHSIVSTSLSAEINLGNGDWYWRIRAVDGAGNKSGWSAASKTTVNYTAVLEGIKNGTQNFYGDVIIKDTADVTGSYPAAVRINSNDSTVTVEGGTLSCSSIRNAAILFGEDAYWVNQNGYGEHYNGTVTFTGAAASLYSSVSNCITAAGIAGKNLTVNFSGQANRSAGIVIRAEQGTGPGNYACSLIQDENLTINGTFGGTALSWFDFSRTTSERWCSVSAFSAGESITVNGDISGTLVSFACAAAQNAYAYGLQADANGSVTVSGDISGKIAALGSYSSYGIYGGSLNITVSGLILSGSAQAGTQEETVLSMINNTEKNRSDLISVSADRYAVYSYQGTSNINLKSGAEIYGKIKIASGTLNVSTGAYVSGKAEASKIVISADTLSGKAVFANGWSSIASVTINVDNAADGVYLLAEKMTSGSQITVKCGSESKKQTYGSTSSLIFSGNKKITLNYSASSSKITMTASGFQTESDTEAPDISSVTVTAAVTGQNALVSWTEALDNVGVSQYRVRYGVNDGSGVYTDVLVNDTQYLLQNLSGGNYYVSVQAVDAAENVSEWTKNVSFSVAAPKGPVTLSGAMPEAEYMYGCTATAVGMLLGYYDLYGYQGYRLDNLIPGTVNVKSRGSDGNMYNMNEFDSVLGKFIASEQYVSLFMNKTEDQEAPYTFIPGTNKELNTAYYDCLAAWLGTGMYGRGGSNYSTSYYFLSLNEASKNHEDAVVDFKCGLDMYVQTVGYKLDGENTKTVKIDTNGGSFTFEDYMAEIDAGRPVIISITEHSMVGYGYDEEKCTVIFDDCYKHDQKMEWGGTYYYANMNRTMESVTTIVFDTSVLKSSANVKLMQNGVSQILAWDAAQGKVGYMATDGNIAPGWRGVWEWSGSEASMWKVVGAGHFAGSTVEQDGILLYNGYGNTFAAWTNLNDGSYGYVSLCHVDGNFQTKCIADFDNNGYDDVIIYDENGSVGIVSDAAAYHDVWHADNPSANSWQLVGAGRFSGASDSIVFKNTSNNHLYLWDNNDLSFSTWDWSQTDIGGIADGWEVAAIGDFSGDGTDDIALINHNDNDAVFVWDNGDCSTAHYMGCLGSGFKIESVGDYNGDDKEDLLLREYNSGWGGVGYWASADAGQWTDLNARIETNMESKFAIIA